jgi:uncharacterized membrane protein YphA (DoxX/SURF4 family)
MAYQRSDFTSGPARQAWLILRLGYFLLLLTVGADKFLGVIVPAWSQYLAPQIQEILPVPPETFMMGTGVIEIILALVVLFIPRYGGYLVALYFWGIIANLLLFGAWYDIALRDFWVSLGALALARLSAQVEEARTPARG